MPPGGQQVGVGDDERRSLHVSPRVALQVGGIPVLHILQVHPVFEDVAPFRSRQQVEVVLAYLTHQHVHPPSAQHGVVALAVVNFHPTGVREVSRQLLVLLLAEAAQHILRLKYALANARLGVAVHIAVYGVDILLAVRDVALLFILLQLLVYLLFLKVSETALRQAVGQQTNLLITQLSNLIKQLHRGLVQQERLVLRERGVGIARVTDIVVDKQLV